MRIFGLAGWSGSGKTTLLTALIPELAALNRIGLSLNGSLDLGQVLGQILDSALELVPGQGAAVVLADPAGGLSVAASVGPMPSCWPGKEPGWSSTTSERTSTAAAVRRDQPARWSTSSAVRAARRWPMATT